ncbi:MAG: hypothetical protein CR986_03105 [Ignavibacteriae bacterium]|nr:MAG: hypothetical protein CR986_03105 [Ignavibacteriota bacterium]
MFWIYPLKFIFDWENKKFEINKNVIKKFFINLKKLIDYRSTDFSSLHNYFFTPNKKVDTIL